MRMRRANDDTMKRVRRREIGDVAPEAPHEALVSGTRNVATYFGTGKEEGTVATGMKANLLVLNANPLQDITRTIDRAGVVHNGTWHDRASLDAMLAKLRVP